MRRTLAVARRELGVYFDSPIAYIFLVVFLSIMGWLFFDWANFFPTGQATMRGFFDFLPWVFIPFIASVSMRLWAEERRTGTEELLLTLPARTSELVLGKFLAALGLIAAGLVGSLPLALTVAALGPLDWGPVIGGYLGALFFGGACVAVGLFLSSLTRNQIIAFILTLVVLFAFYVLGTGQVTMHLPAALVSWVDYVSTGSHYESAGRGVLDLRDLFFYLAFISVFLMLNCAALGWRRWS